MHIVLVETTSVRGFDMVAEMADSGIEVSLVTADLDACRGEPGFELSSRAARIVEVGDLGAGDLAGRLRGRIGPRPPDGVICRDGAFAWAVAELARNLGVPHEVPAAARLLGDRAAVRARLAEHRIGSLRRRGPSQEEAPCGEHLLVLLGGEDPAERILSALGALTARVSVVWTGGPRGQQRARALWRRHYRGMWHSASTGSGIRAAARLIHAAGAVRSFLTFSPSPVAEQLRRGAPAPSAACPPPGHTVVVAAHRGEVRFLAALDEQAGARLCPSGLDPHLLAPLVRRAVRAVREAALEGVVRCVFPATAPHRPGGPDAGAPPLLLPGLDAATIDLYDAVHTRSLVCAVAEAVLGRAPRGERRGTLAVQRALEAPAGRLRAVRATTAGEPDGPPEPEDRPRPPSALPLPPHPPRPLLRLPRPQLKGPTTMSSHLLLLAGIGGLAPAEALDSLSTVADTVSVVYVTAWRPADQVRADFERRALGGEFLEAADLSTAVEAAAGLHGRLPLDGVVTYSELLLRPQALIAARLGLPGNSPTAVAVAQSKARQRLVFAEHGVPGPGFELITGEQDLAAAAARVGLPGVFKPSLGADSQGVRLVSTYAELIHAFTAARAEQTVFLQSDQAYLLEEPMAVEADGDSGYAAYCSVESLLADGVAHHLALSDRLPLEHGYVEEGVVLPSRLGPAAEAAVVELADRAIRAIGLTCGAVHTEIALTADGPRVIEVNARAGGPLPAMFKAAAGYDYAAEIGRSALGLPPAGTPRFDRVALLRFLPIPAGMWRVAAQTPVEELRHTFPELVYVAPRFAIGQRVRRHHTMHLASFMVTAPDRAAARSVAQEVERAMDIRLVPGFDATTRADRD